jgi:hypothetical protein
MSNDWNGSAFLTGSAFITPGASFPASFAIHGDYEAGGATPIGNLTIATNLHYSAFMDTLGTASFSWAADPVGATTVTHTGSAGSSLGTITLSDPPNLVTLQAKISGGYSPMVMAVPSYHSAVVLFTQVTDDDNSEIPDHYVVEATCSAGASPTVTVRAGNGLAVVRGLSNGASCTFEVTPKAQGSTLVASTTSSATTIGVPGVPSGFVDYSGTADNSTMSYPSSTTTDRDAWVVAMGDPLGYGVSPQAIDRTVIGSGSSSSYDLNLDQTTHPFWAFVFATFPRGNGGGMTPEFAPTDPNTAYDNVATNYVPIYTGDGATSGVTLAPQSGVVEAFVQNETWSTAPGWYSYHVTLQTNTALVYGGTLESASGTCDCSNCDNNKVFTHDNDMQYTDPYHSSFKSTFTGQIEPYVTSSRLLKESLPSRSV